MSKKLQLKILDARVGSIFPLPHYATTGSAAIDLYACLDAPKEIPAGECALIPTGIAIHIADPNYVALIFPRSGLGLKAGIVLGNLTGVIDSDYQGPLGVPLWNRASTLFIARPGLRMAQLMLVPVERIEFDIVAEFSAKTARAQNGFGSTGLIGGRGDKL